MDSDNGGMEPNLVIRKMSGPVADILMRTKMPNIFHSLRKITAAVILTILQAPYFQLVFKDKLNGPIWAQV